MRSSRHTHTPAQPPRPARPTLTPSMVEFIQNGLPEHASTEGAQRVLNLYGGQAAAARPSPPPRAPESSLSTRASVVSARLRRRGVPGLQDMAEFVMHSDDAIDNLPPDRKVWLNGLRASVMGDASATLPTVPQPRWPGAQSTGPWPPVAQRIEPASVPAPLSASAYASSSSSASVPAPLSVSTSASASASVPASAPASASASASESKESDSDDDGSVTPTGPGAGKAAQMWEEFRQRWESQAAHYQGIVQDEMELRRLFWDIQTGAVTETP
ncbi:hypothetical protein QBC39DRAFT_399996 [Podospora conica]|nr:hypothetical protein QBC39DRAFT_399996 [Schizothecium conicum]